MKKEFLEYIDDMRAFYKKHWKFIMKIIGIYAAFCAALAAYGHYYCEINEFFQRIKMKILGRKEELSSGGLDYEAPEEEEDDNSVVASF